MILDAAVKRGLRVEIVSKRFNLLKISHNGISKFIKGTSYPANPQPACIIAKNKFLTKKVLRQSGLPVPKGWLVKKTLEAKAVILKNSIFPCVLKPVNGKCGKKVFANIESFKELNEVLPLIFNPGKKDVLVEEFIEGKDYRVLVVGDKVSAAMERLPAHVVGDSWRNIRQLVKKFNQAPLVGETSANPMCKIRFDAEMKRNLKKQGKKLTYVPKKGEKVFLRQNANISTGGIGKDVTDSVSSKIKDIAVRAAKTIGIKITGVDIIYSEASEQPYILELNSCPGIDIHHYPFVGKSRDVAGDIVDFLFK